jgi:2-oxoglutarate dehydrogenase E1 component
VKIYELRKKSLIEGKGIDWATAEQLAFSTLMYEGFPIRLAG